MTGDIGRSPANPAPTFESLTLPNDAQRLNLQQELDPLLRTTLAEARCAAGSSAPVFVGTRGQSGVLMTPWLAQSFSLPVRLGEKILWSMTLPSIRLTSIAQNGVMTEGDAAALLSWLRREESTRAVVLTDVCTTSPLYAALSNAGRLGYNVVRNQPDTHLFHRFRDAYAIFFSELSSKYRNQLRKKQKVFQDRFGDDWKFKEYRSSDEVQAFLVAASAINKKTYQYRMFGETVDCNADSVLAGQRAAAAGAFRSFILWYGDVPLCFVQGHQRADGTYEHRKTGYDPAWRAFAPGIVCNMLLLESLYGSADCPAVLDFGSGDADYKRMFSNEARITANPVLIPRGARYTPATWLFTTSVYANDAAVRLVDKLGIKEWLKRRLRRLD